MNKAFENKSFFLFFFFLFFSLSLFSNYYFNVFHLLEKGRRNHLKYSELTMIYKQPKVKLGLRVLRTAKKKIQSKCSTSFTLSVADCPSVSSVLTTLAPSEVPLIALISTATTGPRGWGFKSKKWSGHNAAWELAETDVWGFRWS